ncbi:porin [Paraburkholderia sp. 1N]|uniref:Porin n=1 Tax=Paraburkholderia solitsugae TaxID=2675748 RepID=A0ABX2C561_9BURK|nr:porin [Paraburkholderia solitsugae]NPT47551.1 porin [Paraburkholderia solitsugae]
MGKEIGVGIGKNVKLLGGVGVLLLGCSSGAFAQSSVYISGFLGAGIGYTSNVGGHSSVSETNGVLRPNSFAIQGKEDLGDGLQALFYLGSLFSMSTGTVLGAPGSLFSRESYVGLSDKYGTLTFGQQRDFMFDMTVHGYAGGYSQGLWGAHQGPFPSFGVPYVIGGSYDFDRLNGEALNNAVKFRSANFSGMTFGAMYGFGGVAGHFGNSSSSSFTVNYEFGSGGVGAAYTMAKSPTIDNGNDGIRNIGVGGKYLVAPVQFSVLGTISRNTGTGAQIDAVDATVSYDFTPFWNLATTYTYMSGNHVLDSVHANQADATLTYRFSKRTSVYGTYVWQEASGKGALARINSTLTSPSSSDAQTMVGISIMHLF